MEAIFSLIPTQFLPFNILNHYKVDVWVVCLKYLVQNSPQKIFSHDTLIFSLFQISFLFSCLNSLILCSCEVVSTPLIFYHLPLFCMASYTTVTYQCPIIDCYTICHAQTKLIKPQPDSLIFAKTHSNFGTTIHNNSQSVVCSLILCTIIMYSFLLLSILVFIVIW